MMDEESATLLIDAAQDVIRGSQDLGKAFIEAFDLIKKNAHKFEDLEEVNRVVGKCLDASKATIMKNNEATEKVRKIKEMHGL